MVFPDCCKDDNRSQLKSMKFDSRHPKMREPVVTKICEVDWVADSTVQNFILGDFATICVKLLSKG